MAREQRYIVPVRTRLDAATGAALREAAADRGVEIGSLVRILIEAGLGRVDALSPIRRKRARVSHPEEFAAAVLHLGSIAGNLQRLYTALLDCHRVDLRALLAAKDEVQEAAAMVRRAIGDFEGA